MSMYQMMNGVNPATFFFLPMLGIGHPDNFPRFRDCFIAKHGWQLLEGLPRMVAEETEPSGHIFVLTRTGGGNRDEYAEEINALQSNSNYVGDWDDEFDSTYMTFKFKVPAEWKNDYDLILQEKWTEVSAEYQARLKEVFPKLIGKFDEIFSTSVNE